MSRVASTDLLYLINLNEINAPRQCKRPKTAAQCAHVMTGRTKSAMASRNVATHGRFLDKLPPLEYSNFVQGRSGRFIDVTTPHDHCDVATKVAPIDSDAFVFDLSGGRQRARMSHVGRNVDGSADGRTDGCDDLLAQRSHVTAG